VTSASAFPASRCCTSWTFGFDSTKCDADFVVSLPDQATGTHCSARIKAHFESRCPNRRCGNAETRTFGCQIADGAVNCACRVRLENQNISSNASACDLSSFDHLNLPAQMATVGRRRISFIKMLEGIRGLEQVNIKPTTAAKKKPGMSGPSRTIGLGLLLNSLSWSILSAPLPSTKERVIWLHQGGVAME